MLPEPRPAAATPGTTVWNPSRAANPLNVVQRHQRRPVALAAALCGSTAVSRRPNGPSAFGRLRPLVDAQSASLGCGPDNSKSADHDSSA
jgi:hypothetical protein